MLFVSHFVITLYVVLPYIMLQEFMLAYVRGNQHFKMHPSHCLHRVSISLTTWACAKAETKKCSQDQSGCVTHCEQRKKGTTLWLVARCQGLPPGMMKAKGKGKSRQPRSTRLWMPFFTLQQEIAALLLILEGVTDSLSAQSLPKHLCCTGEMGARMRPHLKMNIALIVLSSDVLSIASQLHPSCPQSRALCPMARGNKAVLPPDHTTLSSSHSPPAPEGVPGHVSVLGKGRQGGEMIVALLCFVLGHCSWMGAH